MEWLQKIYIFFLNPFITISTKIDDEKKEKIKFITCLALFSTFYIWYSTIGMGVPLTLLMRMLVAIILVAILVFLGLEHSMKPVRWNRLIIYSWFLLGTIIFLMGFFTKQNAGYWMTGPVIAIGFPCLYMVYGNNEKHSIILNSICKSAIICTIMYYAVCLAGEFFNSNTWYANRYNGLTSDANMIGELCLGSFCCLMYYILVNEYSDRWTQKAIISLGLIFGQVYWTQSRTTILAMIAVIFFWLIIIIKDFIKGIDFRKALNKVMVLVFALLIGLMSIFIIDEIRNIHTNNSNFIDIVEASQGNEDDSTKEEDSYRDILPTDGITLNEYSSGRIHIWKVYSRGFNFTGNDANAKEPISSEIQQKTAHNTLIEITYRSGYFAGAMYVVILLCTVAHILKVLFRNNSKNSKCDYFMAIISIAYIIFTSLMPAYNPLTSMVFMLYVLAFPALLQQEKIFK